MPSGGQQRVAIARALVNNPPLIIADEPTGNLDSAMAEEVFQLFRKLVTEGKTILMVTHDDDFARRVDRTVIIADGKVLNEFLGRALRQLSKDLVMEIAATVQPVDFPPGSLVVRQGEVGDCFYIILQGECQIFYTHPAGGEILLHTLEPGEYFGEAALIRAAPRNASVRVGDQPVRLLPVSAALFDHLVKESPNFRLEMERVAIERSWHLAAGGAS